MRKRSNYRTLVSRLTSERQARSDVEAVEVTASERTPQPPVGDTLPESFVNDPKYRELFARSVAGRAAGWPQRAVEKLDRSFQTVFPHFKPVTGAIARDKSRKNTMVDWRDANLSARERKFTRYRECQRLWRSNCRELMRVILDDAPVCPRPPTIDHVERVYCSRFFRREIESLDEPPAVNSIDSRELLRSITADEVTNAIQSLKLNSACGPDRLSISDLKRVGANALSLLFSCWLEAGRMPEWTKRCRTTLLPKGSSSTTDVGDWRPITIGPHISRLYTKILAQRLQRVTKLNPQ